MRDLVRRLALGEHPETLEQEICQAIPKLAVLRRAKPDLVQLLEAHQQAIAPKSSIAIMPTSRYMLAPEATVVALEDIEAGRLIHELPGILIRSNDDLVEQLEASGKANSVIETREAPYWLLGPASKVNHDCCPNAVFRPQPEQRRHPLALSLVARRKIICREEITVSYSDHFFGYQNENCLCASCEASWCNGWRPKAACNDQADLKVVSRRETRSMAHRKRSELLAQAIYSYEKLGDRGLRRRPQDHQALVPESNVSNCAVCGLRVAYNSTPGRCASCDLRKRAG